MNSFRQFVLRACIGLIVLCCGLPIPAQDAEGELQPVRLRLKWKHQFQSAGFYMALEEGYYAEAGLDVEIQEARDDQDAAEAVLSGDAEFGVSTSDLVLLRAAGKPVVALASIYQHSPLVFLANAGAGIETLHDLPGERVMIEPNSAELLAYLEYEGIDPSEIDWIPHTYDVQPLLAGEVAALSAYSTDEPFVLQEAGVDYRIFTPRSGGIDFYGDMLFTSEGVLDDHPEMVRGFLDASLRGWEYALEHPEEAIDVILSEYSDRHSREHLRFEARHTKELILPDVVEIGYMNPGRWQFIADQYRKEGMMAGRIDIREFLYDPEPEPDLTVYYSGLAGLGLVALAVLFVAYRYRRLNRTIRLQMEEMRRIQTHLQMAEERYRVLAENAPFPTTIVRMSDNRISYLNSKAAEMLKMKRDFAIGKTPYDYYAKPERRNELLAQVAQHGFAESFEAELKDAAGNHFWASMSATLVEFEGEPSLFVSFVDLTERKKLEERLQTLALTDELTGLMNRRHFLQRCNEEIGRAHRYDQTTGLLLADLDHFKKINDTYGHAAGDRVLVTIAGVLRESVRDIDLVGRYGGEEFAILLPNTTLEHSTMIAERLRKAVEKLDLAPDIPSEHLTLSVGVALITVDTPTADDVLQQADEALYAAKDRGRNAVVTAPRRR